jgi:3-mercaptopyruvate sulfurtransferase SseA
MIPLLTTPQKQYTHWVFQKYISFKEWHKEYYPFEDTLKAVVDIHPYAWFSGTSVLDGHIPGALNIPSDELVGSTGGVLSLKNEGAILTELIPDKEAKIIVYDSEGESERAQNFLWGARELNYNQLFLFQNGYDEWLLNGDSLSVVN